MRLSYFKPAGGTAVFETAARSMSIGADRPATSGGFTLMPGSEASRSGGILSLRWVLRDLVFRDDTMEEIGRRRVALPAGGLLELRPSRNFLSLEIQDGRLNGHSRRVRPKGGRLLRLPMGLRGGV